MRSVSAAGTKRSRIGKGFGRDSDGGGVCVQVRDLKRGTVGRAEQL